MEYLDFSSVITTIRNYISDAHSMNQIDMMYQLFVSFLSSDESLDFDFDNGLVCRWFNGQAKISPRITRYYMDNHNRNRLAADMHRNVLPLMYDSTMAVQEIYNILVQDTTISDKTKARLLENYPCETEMDEAVFLTSALCFGMERTFVKRDVNTKNLLSAGNLSPAVKDFIYDGGTPKPCRHFCGRDNELVTLHQLLCSHGKVFLQGIAGIGKSELAKAYAKIHSKEYTNILYLSYTGNLKQDISDMDFADDLPDDDNEERFRKHNRFLRTLKEDTLFIIDNFNTTASQDGLLSVVMKYRCRILFTTRSSFNNYTFMNLEEIGDTDALIKLMGCFYSDAEKNRTILEQIIQTVHSHTLAVEMSARLLESGIMEPLLLSNLYANLGGMYKMNGKLELAKENMEQAIRIIDEYGLAYYHDSIVQITNYAVLLTDMGQPDVGLSALRKLCRVIREYNSDTGLDYASVQEAMGNISLTMGEISQATSYFQKAMEIYETVFEFEPDMIEAKKQELLGTYAQAGLYLGEKLLTKEGDI